MNKTLQDFRNTKIARCALTATKNDKWPTGACDRTHIAILAAIILAIGVYLIATTALIAKDGTMYIEYAKKIADDPIAAVRNMQYCPGYPFLIHLMHKVVGLLYNAESIQGWIISAQAVSLMSKIIASIALYFVGSYFVGPRLSFWGVLILSILPDSAEYGSDALSDWPHIMFLVMGFLLLLLAVQYQKCRIFGCVGIIAGLGYLVRSEGCQLILYGSAWLLFNLVRPQNKMKRTKAAGALIFLLAGFAIIAAPYMHFKGYVFPDQRMWKLPKLLSISIDSTLTSHLCLAGLSTKGIIGDDTLITNICETLMYYFTPYLLVGCYYYFRKQAKTLEQTFFAAAFITVNVVMLWWQSHRFLSRRHTLALVMFTVFYIPVGLYIAANWLSKKVSKNNTSTQKDRHRWFFILLIIGITICLPKLLRPIRIEKQSYRQVAKWLRENTTGTDIIAVPDKRIAFYAERKGLEYDENIPEQANYIIRIIKSEDEKPGFGKNMREKYSTWLDKRKKEKRIVIYEAL